MRRLRVVFFGMEGVFSCPPLSALCESDIVQVVGVIVPRPAGMKTPDSSTARIDPPTRYVTDIPLDEAESERNIIGMAWDAGVPVFEVATLSHPHTLAMLSNLAPEVICVACFPKLLPRPIIQLASRAALNLHPALLPAYRGPAPLFWIFHDGLENAGITVHQLGTRADRGDVVAQAPVALPDGIGYSSAERKCAEEGARLLLIALDEIRAGMFTHTPQPEMVVPLAPQPADKDFILTPEWPARRAFNFISGIAEWNREILLEIGSERYSVHLAIAYAESERLEAALEQRGGQWKVRFSPGTLQCKLTRLG
jgi:methionyl-tRNA formyltransferase